MLQRLQKLIELQEIDQAILQRTREIETNIPVRISEITKQSDKLGKEIENLRLRTEEIERKRKQKEREVQDIEEKIKKLKARTPEIKTNKEYQALIKEIETAEKEKFRIEDEILNLMEITEQVKTEVKLQEAEYKKNRAELEIRKKEILELQEKLKKELEGLRQRRSEIVKEIEPDDYELYMSLLEKGKGIALTTAIDAVCQGCFLNIPPQLYVEIKRNDRLIQCPQCKRILYWKQELKVEHSLQRG